MQNNQETSKQVYPRIDLVKEIIDCLKEEKVNQDNFYMGNWKKTIKIEDDGVVQECNTVCCAIGHASNLKSFIDAGLIMEGVIDTYGLYPVIKHPELAQYDRDCILNEDGLIYLFCGLDTISVLNYWNKEYTTTDSSLHYGGYSPAYEISEANVKKAKEYSHDVRDMFYPNGVYLKKYPNMTIAKITKEMVIEQLEKTIKKWQERGPLTYMPIHNG